MAVFIDKDEGEQAARCNGNDGEVSVHYRKDAAVVEFHAKQWRGAGNDSFLRRGGVARKNAQGEKEEWASNNEQKNNRTTIACSDGFTENVH